MTGTASPCCRTQDAETDRIRDGDVPTSDGGENVAGMGDHAGNFNLIGTGNRADEASSLLHLSNGSDHSDDGLAKPRNKQ